MEKTISFKTEQYARCFAECLDNRLVRYVEVGFQDGEWHVVYRNR